MELNQDLLLTQHVHNATRGENTLDPVLSTGPNMTDQIRVRVSDHKIVICDNTVSIQIKECR